MARLFPKLALSQLALPSLPQFPKLDNLKMGESVSSLFDGVAPDRRKYDVAYFPLAYKNEQGDLIYFGTFVPSLLERARTNGSKTAFQDAILLPKKAYVLKKNGHLSPEDIRQVAAQVSKALFPIVNGSRQKQENLNLYSVDRMPAKDLYFDANSNVAQSVPDAKVGELINIYGGARETGYQLPYITPTAREKALHVGFNLMAKFAAIITGLGAGLAFAPVAPYLGVLAGVGTYYVMTSVSQYDFWDKAEDLIRNNWALSPKLWKTKQIDKVKLAKTLGMAALVGYLAFQGGLEIYAGAVNTLVNFAQLPLFAAGAALSAKALLAIKTAAGMLSITAALGSFRGLMILMHNFVGLGYSKTAVSPEERNALPVDEILKQNAQKDSLRSDLTKALLAAQNPCVSKVVALKAIFDDLVAKSEISGDLADDHAYAHAFKAVTEQLPMNMGAWAPAQVFNNLTQAQKLKAIADFKAAGIESPFNVYKNSPEYPAYLTSDRYQLDLGKFRAFLQGNTYKLDKPQGDCCHSKAAAASVMPRTPEAVQFTRNNSPVRAIAANVEMPELFEVSSSSPSRSRSPSRSPSPSVI